MVIKRIYGKMAKKYQRWVFRFDKKVGDTHVPQLGGEAIDIKGEEGMTCEKCMKNKKKAEKRLKKFMESRKKATGKTGVRLKNEGEQASVAES